MKNLELKFLMKKSIYYLYYRHIFKDSSSKNYIEVYCYSKFSQLMFIAKYIVSQGETYCFEYHDIEMCMISNSIDWNFIITTALDNELGCN